MAHNENIIRQLPPLPWTYETNFPVGKPPGTGNVYLVDANGRKIAVFYCRPDEKIAMAEFMCDATASLRPTTD